MNASGISVFYGATNPETVLAEIRPPVGSKALIGKFEILRPLRMLDISAFNSSFFEGSIFDTMYAELLSRSIFLRNLSQRMTRAIMPDDELFDYLPTQVIADFLGSELKFDGIIFPSAQSKEGLNIALFNHASRVKEIKYPENDISQFIDSVFSKSDYLDYIKHIKKRPSRINERESDFSIYIKSDFFLNLINSCLQKDWGGIEDEIYREIIKNHNNLANNKLNIVVDKKSDKLYKNALENIQALNKTVNCIKENLIDYLKSLNDPVNYKYNLFIGDCNNWGSSVPRGIDAGQSMNRKVLFLNFNYTTYLKDKVVEYVQNRVNDHFTTFESIQIHGDIKGKLDDVIFGVGDENKEYYSEIESLYDDDWLMSMKSFHYLRNENYQNLLGFIEDGNYEIYVIGHSCSITDRTLLNMLFENDSCQKIHVYHFEGIESYLKTTYNIARNFNDKVRLRKVLQPYNEKLSTK